MTDATALAQPGAKTSGGALYRLVWKWHFLASLYVLPFMAMLSITGGIYLFKPQFEAWYYADQATVTIATETTSFETQIAALQDQEGIKRLRGVKTFADPTAATQIEFDDPDGVRSIAWIDPYTAKVTGVTARDDMPMRVLRSFHGQLLAGDFGTKFVELAAHWAVVMFVTGVFLWWPRGTRSWGDVLELPKGKGRSFWRETHLFTGFLATLLIVPIIISGLPWTDVWGGGLSYVQEQTNQKSGSLRFGGDVPNSTTSEGTPITMAAVFAVAKAEGLASPYELRAPKDAEAAFWVRSASTTRANQTEMIVDQYSGAVLKRHDFADNPGLAKTVSLGISFHQGELYGTLNVIQNVIAASLGVLLSVSGFIAWWKRRPTGTLGIPAAPEAALGRGMIALIIVLSVLFPLMGASLIVVLLLDWLIFRRLGWFQSERPQSF